MLAGNLGDGNGLANFGDDEWAFVGYRMNVARPVSPASYEVFSTMEIASEDEGA